MSGEAPFVNPLDLLLAKKLGGPEGLRDKLARERLNKLAQTLTLAALESPFYRKLAQKELLGGAKKLAKAAKGQMDYPLAEELIQKILSALPKTSPADLAKSPESFLAVGLNQVEGLTTVPSSGSRGQSKRIFSTAEDLNNVSEFFSHGMLNLIGPLPGPNKPDDSQWDQRARKRQPGSRVALLMSGNRPGSVGDLLSRAMARHLVPVKVLGFLPRDPGELSLYRETLKGFNPTTLVGLPSQVFYLAKTGPKPPGLKNILLSGESAPKSLVMG
ncbi:MAG: hypothetical protein LBF38_08750, partial [Deltaproteobacteria bacterium]|nr:hypothetical protein [Deltaproteobacteria bacterium]